MTASREMEQHDEGTSFATLVASPDFSVAHACLLIARDVYPSLNVAACLERLHEIAGTINARLAADAFTEQRINALNAGLYDELGLRGNATDYYDPRNSYLNDVLDRRTGIPITLAVIYMDVGRRIGLDLQGVSFPGHFLVKVPHRQGWLVLDPFDRGTPQSEARLRERLVEAMPQLRGQAGTIGLGPFLGSAPPREIVARVLRNLKAIHMKAGRHAELLAVLDRSLELAPGSPDDLRDRGLAWEQLECFAPAAHDLEAYLRTRPDAADGEATRERIARLRQAAARLN